MPLILKWLLIALICGFAVSGITTPWLGSQAGGIVGLVSAAVIWWKGGGNEAEERSAGLTQGALPKLVALWTVVGVVTWVLFSVLATLVFRRDGYDIVGITIATLAGISVGVIGYHRHKFRTEAEAKRLTITP